MKRNVSVEDISDGRSYRPDDLVKIGTNGCAGCSDCCRMDALIVLDPHDIYDLQKATGQGLEGLLGRTVRLEVIDGLIQPVLNMADGVCPYLGADGRCGIHPFRPGICRLYPLGRSWQDGDFSYILQVGECTHCTGSKVKVRKWLGIPNLAAYEDYCRKWHAFLKKAQQVCDLGEAEEAGDERPAGAQAASAADRGGSGAMGIKARAAAGKGIRHLVCMLILEKCYMAGFDTDKDFYDQFGAQLKAACGSMGFMI